MVRVSECGMHGAVDSSTDVPVVADRAGRVECGRAHAKRLGQPFYYLNDGQGLAVAVQNLDDERIDLVVDRYEGVFGKVVGQQVTGQRVFDP